MIVRHLGVLALCFAAAWPSLATAQDAGQAARVQAALEAWVSERAEPEGVTGAAAYVSLGEDGPAIEAFAGRTGRGDDAPPVDQATLFQMGSTSKSFTVAVILKLEAESKLSLDDLVGAWLPQYPAWADVTIRELLNMTSGIPNYSETEELSRIWIEEPQRTLTAAELVQLAYPSGTDADLPATTGYAYSNTNYVLAGMIAAQAAGKPLRDLVHEMLLTPLGLDSTFFEVEGYPPDVISRLAHGYFENPACTDFQPPDCAGSWNLPLVGRDVRGDSTSWAQAAGGAISNARDTTRWIRAVFAGRVVPPEQQEEWLSLVSTRTGEPLDEVSEENPQGFALGLVRGWINGSGANWFYQGTTLGYRTLYVWFEDEDILITVQTNSQPADGANALSDAVAAIHGALQPPAP